MDNLLFKTGNSGQVNVDQLQGIVECFVAGIGNKDSVGDVVVTGAFAKSLLRRKPRVVWGHSWNDPIGKVLEMYEVPVGDSRLPAKMRNAGIGGLYAKVQFNLQSEKGKEAFATVAFFGEDQEWSIGYKTIDSVFDQSLQANILKELELYEVSPVLHGANQLTGTISIKTDEKAHMPIIPMQVDGMPMMPTMNQAPRIVVVAAPTDQQDESSTDNPFAEGMSRELGQPEKDALQAELMDRTGSQIEVMNATENIVVFRRTTSDGKASMYRLPYHKEGSLYMFGKPEPYQAEAPQPQPMQNIQQKPGAPVVVPNAGIAYRNDDQQEMMNLFSGNVAMPFEKSDVSHLIELPEVYMAAAKDYLNPVLRHHKLAGRPSSKGIIIDGLLTANALDALQNAVKALGSTIGQASGNIGQAIGKIRDLAQSFNPYALDGDGDGFVQDGSAFQRPYIPIKKPGFDLPDVRGRKRSGDSLLDKPKAASKLPKDKNTWTRAQRNDALVSGLIEPETREDIAFLSNKRPDNEGIAKYWDMSEADLTKEGNRLVNARRQATGAEKEKIDEELLKVSHDFQRRASYAETFGQDFVPPAKREMPNADLVPVDITENESIARMLGAPKSKIPRTDEGFASRYNKYVDKFDAVVEQMELDSSATWDELDEDSQIEFIKELDYDYMYDVHGGLGDDGIVEAMESGKYDDEIAEFAEDAWNTIAEEKKLTADKERRQLDQDEAEDPRNIADAEEAARIEREELEEERRIERDRDRAADAAIDQALEQYIEEYGEDAPTPGFASTGDKPFTNTEVLMEVARRDGWRGGDRQPSRTSYDKANEALNDWNNLSEEERSNLLDDDEPTIEQFVDALLKARDTRLSKVRADRKLRTDAEKKRRADEVGRVKKFTRGDLSSVDTEGLYDGFNDEDEYGNRSRFSREYVNAVRENWKDMSQDDRDKAMRDYDTVVDDPDSVTETLRDAFEDYGYKNPKFQKIIEEMQSAADDDYEMSGLASRGEGKFGSNPEDSKAAKAFDAMLEKYWKMWGFDVPDEDEEGQDEPFGFASRGNNEEVKQEKLDELVEGVRTRLLAELETADPATWKPSWRNDSLPINVTTGKPYRGFNAFWLMLRASGEKYKTGRYAGYDQLKARGAQVRKGEKGVPILRPQLVKKVDADGNEKEFVRFRGTTVFNIDQADGGDEALRAVAADLPEEQRIAILDTTIAELGVDVRTENTTPHYNPTEDYISMPEFAKGTSPIEWSSTLAHETVHWTGGASRLNRPSVANYSDDKKTRAYEELVAEIGSAMFLAAHGIEAPFRQDHAPYIKGWLQLLKDDPDALGRAFKDAQAAINHLLEKSPNLRKLFGGLDNGKKAPEIDAPDKAEALVGASDGFASLHRVRTPRSEALTGILYDDNSGDLMVGFQKGKPWDKLTEGERENWIGKAEESLRDRGGLPLTDDIDAVAKDMYDDLRDTGWYVYSDVSMNEVQELAAARSKGKHINALKKLKTARKATDEDNFNFFGRDERVQDVGRSMSPDGFASRGAAEPNEGLRRHKLMPAEVRAGMPDLYSTEDVPLEEKVLAAKFFSPYSNWTWYAVEFDGDDTFFGYVEGFENEWGNFSLSEIAGATLGGSLPAVERDRGFRPTKFGDLNKSDGLASRGGNENISIEKDRRGQWVMSAMVNGNRGASEENRGTRRMQYTVVGGSRRDALKAFRDYMDDNNVSFSGEDGFASSGSKRLGVEPRFTDSDWVDKTQQRILRSGLDFQSLSENDKIDWANSFLDEWLRENDMGYGLSDVANGRRISKRPDIELLNYAEDAFARMSDAHATRRSGFGEETQGLASVGGRTRRLGIQPSEAVDYVSYDPDSESLFVAYKREDGRGEMYVYEGVDMDDAIGVENARSVGRAINDIKRRKNVRKATPDEVVGLSDSESKEGKALKRAKTLNTIDAVYGDSRHGNKNRDVQLEINADRIDVDGGTVTWTSSDDTAKYSISMDDDGGYTVTAEKLVPGDRETPDDWEELSSVQTDTREDAITALFEAANAKISGDIEEQKLDRELAEAKRELDRSGDAPGVVSLDVTYSSALDAVDYNPSTQEMRVSFKDGGTYIYEGVDRETFDGFSAAPSKGRAMNDIKRAYPYRKDSEWAGGGDDDGGVEEFDVRGSEAVEKVSYDPETEDMLVVYAGGKGYVYTGVTRAEADAVRSAPSKGRAINDVKRTHEVRLLKGEDIRLFGGKKDSEREAELSPSQADQYKRIARSVADQIINGEDEVVEDPAFDRRLRGLYYPEWDVVPDWLKKSQTEWMNENNPKSSGSWTEDEVGQMFNAARETLMNTGVKGKERKVTSGRKIPKSELDRFEKETRDGLFDMMRKTYDSLLMSNDYDKEKANAEFGEMFDGNTIEFVSDSAVLSGDVPIIDADGDRIDPQGYKIRPIKGFDQYERVIPAGADIGTESIDPAPVAKPKMPTSKPPRGGKRVRNRNVVISMEQGDLDEIIAAESGKTTVDALRAAKGVGKYTKGPRKGKRRGPDTIAVRDAETGELLHYNEIELTSSSARGYVGRKQGQSPTGRKRGFIRARSYAGRQNHKITGDEGPNLRGEGKGMTEYDKRVYGLGSDEKNREFGLASRGRLLDSTPQEEKESFENYLDSQYGADFMDYTQMSDEEVKNSVMRGYRYSRSEANAFVKKLRKDQDRYDELSMAADDALDGEDGFASRSYDPSKNLAPERYVGYGVERYGNFDKEKLLEDLELYRDRDQDEAERIADYWEQSDALWDEYFKDAISDADGDVNRAFSLAADRAYEDYLDQANYSMERESEGFASRGGQGRLGFVMADIERSATMPNNMDILLGDRDYSDLTQEERVGVVEKLAELFPQIKETRDWERYGSGNTSFGRNFYQRRLDFARAGEEISSEYDWDVEKLDDGSIRWTTGDPDGGDLENNGDVGFVGTITKRPDGKYESSWYTQGLSNMSPPRGARGLPENYDPGDSGDIEEINSGGGVFDTLEEAAEDAYDDGVGSFQPDDYYDPYDDRDRGFASRSGVIQPNEMPERPRVFELEWINFEQLDTETQDQIIQDHIDNIDRVAQPEIDLEAEREFAIEQWNEAARDARAEVAESLLKEIYDLWDQDADADNPFQRNGNLAYAEELIKNTSYVEDLDLAEARNIVDEVRERFERRNRDSIDDDGDGFASQGGRIRMSNGDPQMDIWVSDEGDEYYEATRDGYYPIGRTSNSRGRYYPESGATYGGTGLDDDQKKEIAETLKESTDPFIQKLLGDLEFRGRLSDKQWGVLKGRADREKKKTAPKKPSGFVSNVRNGGTIAPGARPVVSAGKDSIVSPTREQIADIAGLEKIISEAKYNGQALRFNYNGKEREVFPVSTYTNPKTGKVNMVGQDADGVQKTFTIDKMSPSEMASISNDGFGSRGDAPTKTSLRRAATEKRAEIRSMIEDQGLFDPREPSERPAYNAMEKRIDDAQAELRDIERQIRKMPARGSTEEGFASRYNQEYDPAYDAPEYDDAEVKEYYDEEVLEWAADATLEDFMELNYPSKYRNETEDPFTEDELTKLYNDGNFEDIVAMLPDQIADRYGDDFTERAQERLDDSYLSMQADAALDRYEAGFASRGAGKAGIQNVKREYYDSDEEYDDILSALQSAENQNLGREIVPMDDGTGKMVPTEVFWGSRPNSEGVSAADDWVWDFAPKGEWMEIGVGESSNVSRVWVKPNSNGSNSGGYFGNEAMVMFKNGKVYKYDNVTRPALIEQLTNTSAGKAVRAITYPDGEKAEFTVVGELSDAIAVVKGDGFASRMTEADRNDLRADTANYPDDYEADMANMASQDMANNFARLSKDDQNMYFQRALANNADSGMTTEQILDEARKLAMDDRQMATLERQAIGMGGSSKPRKIDVSSSSALNSVSYDEMNESLQVEYRGRDGKGTGTIYTYQGVTPDFVDRIEAADSRGATMREIRDNFEFTTGRKLPDSAYEGLASRGSINESSTGQRIVPSKMHSDDREALAEVNDPEERKKYIDRLIDFYGPRIFARPSSPKRKKIVQTQDENGYWVGPDGKPADIDEGFASRGGRRSTSEMGNELNEIKVPNSMLNRMEGTEATEYREKLVNARNQAAIEMVYANGLDPKKIRSLYDISADEDDQDVLEQFDEAISDADERLEALRTDKSVALAKQYASSIALSRAQDVAKSVRDGSSERRSYWDTDEEFIEALREDHNSLLGDVLEFVNDESEGEASSETYTLEHDTFVYSEDQAMLAGLQKRIDSARTEDDFDEVRTTLDNFMSGLVDSHENLYREDEAFYDYDIEYIPDEDELKPSRLTAFLEGQDADGFASRGNRRRPGRRNQGNRRQPMAPKTRYSDEDRQALADGNVLRSRTRPAKRRQGPSADEFDGFASTGTVDDVQDMATDPRGVFEGGEHGPGKDISLKKMWENIRRSGENNEWFSDSIRAEDFARELNIPRNVAQGLLDARPQSGGPELFIDDPYLADTLSNRMGITPARLFGFNPLEYFDNEGNPARDEDAIDAVIGSERARRSARVAAREGRRTGKADLYRGENTSVDVRELESKLNVKLTDENGDLLPAGAMERATRDTGLGWGLEKWRRISSRGGALTPQDIEGLVKRGILDQSRMPERGDLSFREVFQWPGFAGFSRNQIIDALSETLGLDRDEIKKQQRTIEEALSRARKGERELVSTRNLQASKLKISKAKIAEMVEKLGLDIDEFDSWFNSPSADKN